VHLRSDSRLLIEQLAGRFKVKNPTLIRMHEEARDLVRGFDTVTFEHIPREENTEADRLANQGVDAWLETYGPYEPAEQATPPLFEA
jgi:ribonuclease HI